MASILSASVGPIVDALPRLAVHGEDIGPQVVHARPHHDVVAAEVLVPALEVPYHVMGNKGIGPMGYLELAAGRKDIQATLAETLFQVCCSYCLPLTAGLAAFQLGGGKIGDVFLEGPDGF